LAAIFRAACVIADQARFRAKWTFGFRDGAHGVAVWGLAVTVAAIVAALVAASVIWSSSAVSANSGLGRNDPAGIAIDKLLRTTRAQAGAQTSDIRLEVSRLLTGLAARDIAGAPGFAATDRLDLAELVAARSGLDQVEAEKRVGEIVTQLTAALDRARRVTALFGFIMTATLLLSAAAAWTAAALGGRHRDENTLWPGLVRQASAPNLWRK
jgi:hypothetical protein